MLRQRDTTHRSSHDCFDHDCHNDDDAGREDAPQADPLHIGHKRLVLIRLIFFSPFLFSHRIHPALPLNSQLLHIAPTPIIAEIAAYPKKNVR